jgi:glutathione S-transferase
MAFLRPILYGYWSSSCTWRVRIALQYKGIDYEMRSIQRDELVSLFFGIFLYHLGTYLTIKEF